MFFIKSNTHEIALKQKQSIQALPMLFVLLDTAPTGYLVCLGLHQTNKQLDQALASEKREQGQLCGWTLKRSRPWRHRILSETAISSKLQLQHCPGMLCWCTNDSRLSRGNDCPGYSASPILPLHLGVYSRVSMSESSFWPTVPFECQKLQIISIRTRRAVNGIIYPIMKLTTS